MLRIERYPGTRFWGLYESGQLLCVTVYKKGANAVKARLDGTQLPVARAEERQAPSLVN